MDLVCERLKHMTRAQNADAEQLLSELDGDGLPAEPEQTSRPGSASSRPASSVPVVSRASPRVVDAPVAPAPSKPAVPRLKIPAQS